MKKDLKISELNETYGQLLTARQREMVESYYDYDLSLAEIAQNEGVTRQAVRDAIVKSVEQLNSFEGALGVLALKEALKSDLAEVKKQIESGNCEVALDLMAKLVGKI